MKDKWLVHTHTVTQTPGPTFGDIVHVALIDHLQMGGLQI